MLAFRSFSESSYDRVLEQDDNDTPYDANFEIDDDDDDDDDENDTSSVEEFDLEHQKSSAVQSPMFATCSGSATATANTQLVPSNYFCPLTLHLMDDPVLDGCGHCFDRDAITSWLTYHSLCPISRKPLRPVDLISAAALQERIQHWKKVHRSFDADPDLLVLSDTDSHSQLELMLLPQERRVLSLIKFRKRIRTERETRVRCLWSVVGVIMLFCVTTVFLAIYIYDVKLRGPL